MAAFSAPPGNVASRALRPCNGSLSPDRTLGVSEGIAILKGPATVDGPAFLQHSGRHSCRPNRVQSAVQARARASAAPPRYATGRVPVVRLRIPGALLPLGHCFGLPAAGD